MPTVVEGQTYTSPVHKLLAFFERSRDGWKRKCRETKVALKRTKNRAGALQMSRNRWKDVARERAEEVTRLRRELAAQKTRGG